MAQCQNCKAPMGCSCSQRRASDGKICCSSCVYAYEEQLKKNREAQRQLNAQARLKL